MWQWRRQPPLPGAHAKGLAIASEWQLEAACVNYGEDDHLAAMARRRHYRVTRVPRIRSGLSQDSSCALCT
eukprot:CAMPEP_0171068756 /NCGR_PEP_ID=MMETSP0766_2-20121228/8756_1 /TAXON_ID=439317 /ORGANISM="Gambierdiscus australes, Strain CAWD 149" /LENGTH=70 /DNA_ID=CAMNT_0011525103 /DNA_START=47 /DNA_END=256 /DNA_ORIENTATION=+